MRLKAIFFSLLALFGLCSPLGARAQMDLIMRHQAWADSVYANPAALPLETQIREAVTIIGNNLQEDSAMGLLSALGQQIPEMKTYVKFSKSGKVDRLSKHTVDALKALADFAEADKRLPKNLARYCRLQQYIAEGNVSDMTDKWDRLIAESSKANDTEARMLLAMMKVVRFIQRTVRQDFDNPLDYPELFRIETEAFLACRKAPDDSFLKAQLYYWLGELKNLPADDLIAGLESQKVFGTHGLDFIMTGPRELYPNNAGTYYQKSLEISRRILNPGHPWIHTVAQADIYFRFNHFTPDEKAFDEIKESYDYTRYYFPAGSPEVAVNRTLFCLDMLRNGRPTAEDLFLQSSIDIIEEYLGKNNPIFHQHLLQIAFTILTLDPDNEYWLNRLTEAYEASGFNLDDVSDEILLPFSQIYIYFYQMNRETALESIELLQEEYFKGHNPSMRSVLIGRTLADFYSNQLYDYQTASNLNILVLSDLNKLLGGKGWKNPLYWEYQIGQQRLFSQLLPESGNEGYKTLYDLLRLQEFEGADIVSYHLLRDWADFRKNRLHDYSGAAELLEQALPFVEYMPDAQVYLNTNIGVMKQVAGEPQEKTRPYIDAARMLLLACSDSDGIPRGISLTSTISLSDYFYNIGEFEQARDINEMQIRYYERSNGNAFSETYLNLRQSLAGCLEALGEHNESRRILSENREMMTAAYGTVPSSLLLDCLWDDYTFSRYDNIADMVTLFSKLSQIQSYTMALIQSSNNDKSLIYTYGARAIGECLYISAQNYNPDETNRVARDGTPEQKQALETTMTNYRALAEQCEIIARDFKVYDPNYIHNPDYKRFIAALGTYYNLVSQEPEKSLEIQKEVLAASVFPEEKVQILMDMVWILYKSGRKQEAFGYMDRVEALLPSLSFVTPDLKTDIDNFRLRQYIDLGEYDKAVPYARDSYRVHREILDGNFQLMTSKEQNDYLNSRGDPAQSLTGLLEFLPEKLAGEVYDATVYRTGMQLRSQRATKEAIQNSTDPQVAAMLDSINSLRATINGMGAWHSGSSQEETNARTFALSDLQQRLNRVEQKLLDATAHLRRGTIADISWQQIRDRLAPDEAAVEFVYSANHVMALILRPGCDAPKAVTLTTGDSLCELLNSQGTKNSAALAQKLYKQGNLTLYNMIWEPLAPHIAGVRRIYYTMPGILSSLAVNAFSTPSGKTLFDEYDLVQLTTTAQLEFDRPQRVPRSIALMGDILYDPAQKPVAVNSAEAREVDRDFSLTDTDSERALVKSHFRHLPFTAIEIESISSQFSLEQVDSVRRHNATEQRLREMVSRKPDILHLATHGYYVTPDIDLSALPFFSKKGNGTMQRSGVALAGAEQTWRGKSDTDDAADGIVTAAEVAEFDLSSTDLVTLSACETALGDYSFEGVFGLQRGFKQAGAKSLLVSLWSVNDRSTSLFMSTFYDRIRNGAARQSAWRDAVAEVRAQYPEPYYWAPFIILDGR